MKKFKWKSANIPKEAREFTDVENAILDKLKFGKSELGKARKEAKRNVRFTITLLEKNGGLKKGCYMAVHELGKLLGSVKTAQRVIDCIAPIITCNNHWVRESKTPRRFKIDELFKNCNVMAELKENTMKRDLVDVSELLEALGLDDLEERVETPEDYIEAGIDPSTRKYCPNCRLTYSIMAFTLSKHRVCVDCWHKKPDDAMESSRIDYIEKLPRGYEYTLKDEMELFDYQDYMK